MEIAQARPDIFAHVRILVGIVTALSISRLLTGLARFIQHPRREHAYPIHIGWVLFMLSAIVHFWWYEFHLSTIPHWVFEVYIFVILYAFLFFLLCTLLFPDRMDEYSGFEEYFLSRKKWFFGLLTLIFLVDFIDTAIKGESYFHHLGLEYLIRQSVFAVLSIVAIFVQNRIYQAAFVVFALIYQGWWIISQFHALS